MKGADLVLKIIEEHGVTQVFGYPGGAIMPVYDALLDSPVSHFLFRHEQGAGFSAVGYARASGKTGVCIATSGPGATNLVTALADAKLDSVPIVAITGQVSSSVLGTDAFQEMDVLGMSISMTKHSFMVERVEDLATTLREAFKIAASGRPGPVLVDIPKDIQLSEVDYVPYAIANKPELPVDDAAILKAQRLLLEADKPIAYVGGGVGMANAEHELRAFLKDSQIPSVTTLKGIGAVAGDDPNLLGMLGMHGTKTANLCVQETDLLICIGARFDDRVTGKLKEFAPNAKVIHLDIDESECAKRRTPDVFICGDLKAILPKIGIRKNYSNWIKQCQQRKQDFPWQYDHPGHGIYGPALLNELSETLEDSDMVSCDVGQHQMWVAQHMSFNSPKNHLSSGGLGTMGFGLPAAIGAQFARPENQSIVVSGDGSFMMNVQELSTLKRYQIPVKIVLLDNQRLGMVKQWQQLFFNQRYSETNLSDNPDFVTMASAFDIQGQKITEKSQVSKALNDMLNHDGPYLLHVSISELDNVWPLVPPETANHKMMERSQ